MSPPAPALFADSPLATAVAWWWFLRTQTTVYNPRGVLFRRLQQCHEPPYGFLALAAAWPGLAAADREEMSIAATGRHNGLLLNAPARDGHELRRRLPDELELDEAALAAYLQLLQHAPEELRHDD